MSEGMIHSERQNERTTRTRENQISGFMSESVLMPAVLTTITSFPRIIMIMWTSMATRNARGMSRLKLLGMFKAT